jgi:hypothetical protein
MHAKININQNSLSLGDPLEAPDLGPGPGLALPSLLFPFPLNNETVKCSAALNVPFIPLFIFPFVVGVPFDGVGEGDGVVVRDPSFIVFSITGIRVPPSRSRSFSRLDEDLLFFSPSLLLREEGSWDRWVRRVFDSSASMSRSLPASDATLPFS